MIISNKKFKEFEAQTLEKNKELDAQSKIKVPYKKNVYSFSGFEVHLPE